MGRAQITKMPCRWLCIARTAHFSWGQYSSCAWGTSRRLHCSATLPSGVCVTSISDPNVSLPFVHYQIFSPALQSKLGWMEHSGDVLCWKDSPYCCWIAVGVCHRVDSGNKANHFPFSIIVLDETGITVSFVPVLPQSDAKNPRIYPGLEYHRVYNGSEVQDTKSVKGEQ